MKTEDGETPLHLGKIKQLFFKKSFNQNTIACISEQLQVANLLIEKGCDQQLKDAEGKTAFEQADECFIRQLSI